MALPTPAHDPPPSARPAKQKLTKDAYAILQDFFHNVTRYPTKSQREQLAAQISALPGCSNLPQQKVQQYFTNKRAIDRRSARKDVRRSGDAEVGCKPEPSDETLLPVGACKIEASTETLPPAPAREDGELSRVASSSPASTHIRATTYSRLPKDAYVILRAYFRDVTEYPTLAQREELAEKIRQLPGGKECTHLKVQQYFGSRRVHSDQAKRRLADIAREMDLPRASTTCQDVEMAAPQDPAPVPSQTSDIHSMTAPTHGSTPPPTAPLQITSIEPEQPYPVAVPVFLSGHRGLYPNHPFSLTYKFADGVLHSLPFTWNALFDHLPKSVEIKAGVVEDVGRRTSTVGAMPSPSPHDDPDSVAPHGCPHELAAELQRALNDSTEDSLTEAATPKTFAELASWFGAQGSLSVDVNKLRMGGCQHMSTDGLAW